MSTTSIRTSITKLKMPHENVTSVCSLVKEKLKTKLREAKNMKLSKKGGAGNKGRCYVLLKMRQLVKTERILSIPRFKTESRRVKYIRILFFALKCLSIWHNGSRTTNDKCSRGYQLFI